MNSQKLGLVLAAGSLLFSSGSQAITIGSPQLDSYLAQPLLAFVPVSDLDIGKHPSYYKIRALPASEYSALGLDPPDFPVQNLKVSWVSSERGQGRISISSQRAVTEPVVTVLLEIRGPRQRWVRQLNLLLDPPPAGASASTELPKVAPQPNTANATRRNTQYGPVSRGEVLSVIAQNVRMDRSIPLTKMAQAIIDANKTAFPNGPRSLSSGVMLNIPTAEQIELASNNVALMAPKKAPAPQAVEPSNHSRKSKLSKAAASAPFLPKYKHTKGHFYPLTVQFLSYEDIRPVNLQPALRALEAAEPMRFRADWTLSLKPKGETIASNSSTDTEVSPLSIAAISDVDEDRNKTVEDAAFAIAVRSPDTAQLELAADASQATQGQASTTRAQYYRPMESSKDEPVSDVKLNNINSAPLSETSSSDAIETSLSTVESSTSKNIVNKSNSKRWLWWLLLAPAVAFIAWLQRNSWQLRKPNSDTSEPALAPTIDDESQQQAKPSQRSPEQDIVRQAIKRRLKVALESTEENNARQAKVALALFDRGRIDEAEILTEELLARIEEQTAAKLAQENQNLETAPTLRTVQPVKKSPAASATLENSEFEQRRLLKAARKLLSSNLSHESERQVKVATALCERGNTERAQQILEKVKTELQKQESATRSAS
ncbi:MAG: hypothetical protein ACSHXK_04290 [Oceanococcus sp.]